MKNLKRVGLVLFIFGVIFSDSLDVKALSKWGGKTIDLGNTSDGVLAEVIVESKGQYFYFSEIKYTISEDYKGEKIVINAGQDVIDTMNDKTYMPGDASDLKITIINNSKYTYSYINNSFYISTEDYSKYLDNGLASKLNSTIGELKVFDGNILPKEYTTLRTKNTAIQALYGVNGTSKVSDDMVTDDVLDGKLKEVVSLDGRVKYPNGIGDLNKYYLDFYNDKYKTNYEHLEDFDNKMIREMFNGNVNRSEIYETNYEVAKLGYDWFYKHLLTISPSSIDSKEDIYAVGSYMENYSNGVDTPFEKYYRDSFDKIRKGSYSVIGFVMNLNGPDTVNVYQYYNFGFTLGFELEAVKGYVTTNFVDRDGNILKEAIVTEDMVGNSYKTNSVDIMGYKLVETKGNESGEYIDGNIDVIYVYDKEVVKEVSTEINDIETNDNNLELLPPQTGAGSKDSQMDDDIDFGNIIKLLSGISIIGILIFNKFIK